MMPHQHGFTLIELILVIIITSILAVGVYISWPAVTIDLEAQAQQIANDIRYAQMLSMSKGERYRFVRISSTSYQITNGSGSAILLPTGSTAATLYTGITFDAFTQLPNNLIAFDGKGIPYVDTGSPGTALSSTATIPITSNGETRTISITPNTGYASLQ